MKFIEAFSKAKKSVHFLKGYDTDLPLFEIMFSLSKTVKNKVAFLALRNAKIDFDFKKYQHDVEDYYKFQKPLSQIVHEAKFLGLTLVVKPNIFEPRADTEHWTNIIIQMLNLNKKGGEVLDLCCGTGCIGLAIKKHVRDANVTLVDIDKLAVENTKINAQKCDLDVKVYCDDYLDFIKSHKAKFDVIVCNPPYLGVDELHKNLISYENKIAFNNSDEELAFYRNILKNKHLITRTKAKIIFEFGHTQHLMISNLLRENKLLDQSFFLRDLNGFYRCVVINL